MKINYRKCDVNEGYCSPVEKYSEKELCENAYDNA